MEKAKVFFTKEITKEKLVQLYKYVGVKLDGKVAVKVHSGEVGNQNFIRPEFFENIIKEVNGTIVECNTAYKGSRNTTEKHKQTMSKHGWDKYFTVDILDENGDLKLPVKNGKHLTENYVGKNIENYNSMLVLSHFKGHPMGGFGGAIKNIAIGLASSYGKGIIHGAGDYSKIWSADHDSFLESMVEASQTILDYYKNKIVFVNIMKNMSVDCDCCAVAKDPEIEDIGMLASTDPLALDKACVDLVYKSTDPGKKHLIERIESRNGIHTLNYAKTRKLGNENYELIEV